MNFCRLLMALVALVAQIRIANGQVILYGCSASIGGQPLTTSRLVDIDTSTGLATNPRDTGILFLTGIAVQPGTGQIFALTMLNSSPANSLLRLDPNTGAPTLVGATGLSQIVEGDLAFNPTDGMLYGVQNGAGAGVQRQIFHINPSTGAATVIGNTGSTGDLSALAFSPNGTLFTIDTSGTGNSLLQTINPATGLITNTIAMNVNLGSAAALTFSPINGTAYVADGGDASATDMLYSLDTLTGTLTPIGSTGLATGLSGLAFVSVPEPSSFALFGLFAIGCRFARRSRKQFRSDL
jgi:hypothetical protein